MEENETRVPFHDVYNPKRYYSKHKFKNLSKVDKKYRTSLYRLYLFYRYKLNRYKRYESKTPMTEEKRKAIEQMDKYSQEAMFLSSKKIHTSEELFLYKQALELELENLDLDYMKALRNGKTFMTKSEIRFKTNLLKKEVEMCKSIEERIPKIKEELRTKEDEKENRKERYIDEHNR